MGGEYVKWKDMWWKDRLRNAQIIARYERKFYQEPFMHPRTIEEADKILEKWFGVTRVLN